MSSLRGKRIDYRMGTEPELKVTPYSGQEALLRITIDLDPMRPLNQQLLPITGPPDFAASTGYWHILDLDQVAGGDFVKSELLGSGTEILVIAVRNRNNFAVGVERDAEERRSVTIRIVLACSVPQT